MFAERGVWTISLKERVELFVISYQWSILSPLIMKYELFLVITLIEQFIYGGPSLFYI